MLDKYVQVQRCQAFKPNMLLDLFEQVGFVALERSGRSALVGE